MFNGIGIYIHTYISILNKWKKRREKNHNFVQYKLGTQFVYIKIQTDGTFHHFFFLSILHVCLFVTIW